MNQRDDAPTVWRLTLEPAGDDLAWALLRAREGEPTRAVAAGLLDGIQTLLDVADSLHPRVSTHRAQQHWETDLLDPSRELAAALCLGSALLPDPLRAALLADRPSATARSVRHQVEIAARGWPAALAWDAMAVNGDGVRLLELAQIRAAMSPGVLAHRARVADWGDPSAPGLAVLDPGPVVGRFGSIYAGEPKRYPSRLWAAHGLAREDLVAPGGHPLSRDQFADLVGQTNWSRLLYLGHVQAPDPDSPADAALVFEHDGQPDLLSARRWLAGPDRWPAPARVALIACGSDDAAYQETSGLVAAAVNAGARLVSTTRWPLPVDRRWLGHRATTELTLAVHHAHRRRAPVRALRAWQLDQLHRWRAEPSFETSPLLWAGLRTYAVAGGA